jgi:hypothetical protein
LANLNSTLDLLVAVSCQINERNEFDNKKKGSRYKKFVQDDVAKPFPSSHNESKTLKSEKKTKLKGPKSLPESAIEIMIEYFEAHAGHPYPSLEDRKLLALQGKISENQVKAWFANRRNRAKKRALKLENATQSTKHPAPTLNSPDASSHYTQAQETCQIFESKQKKPITNHPMYSPAFKPSPVASCMIPSNSKEYEKTFDPTDGQINHETQKASFSKLKFAPKAVAKIEPPQSIVHTMMCHEDEHQSSHNQNGISIKTEAISHVDRSMSDFDQISLSEAKMQDYCDFKLESNQSECYENCCYDIKPPLLQPPPPQLYGYNYSSMYNDVNNINESILSCTEQNPFLNQNSNNFLSFFSNAIQPMMQQQPTYYHQNIFQQQKCETPPPLLTKSNNRFNSNSVESSNLPIYNSSLINNPYQLSNYDCHDAVMTNSHLAHSDDCNIYANPNKIFCSSKQQMPFQEQCQSGSPMQEYEEYDSSSPFSNVSTSSNNSNNSNMFLPTNVNKSIYAQAQMQGCLALKQNSRVKKDFQKQSQNRCFNPDLKTRE